MHLYALTGEATDVLAQATREIDRLLEEGDPEVDDADKYQVLITEQELYRRIREFTELRALALAGLSRQLLLGEGAIAFPAEAVLQPLDFAPLTLERVLYPGARQTALSWPVHAPDYTLRRRSSR